MMKLLLVLGAALLVSASPRCDEYNLTQQCAEWTSWTETLFNGMTEFPALGKTYCRLVVFKEHAQIILPIIALAKLGAGRVAAIAHSRHVENFGNVEDNNDLGTFHDGLLTWLKDGSTQPWKICKPTSSQELSDCLKDPDVRTLLWAGGLWPSCGDNKLVKTWVEQGGTLVHGYDKTAFEAATVESAKKIPFYSTLIDAGIAYLWWPVTLHGRFSLIIGENTDYYLTTRNIKHELVFMSWEYVIYWKFLNVHFITKMVEDDYTYFPPDVASEVLKPIEAFAIEMEVNMVWPDATPSNALPIDIDERQKIMFGVYYALGLAHLWKAKAPNVDKFPGDVPAPLPPTETASFSFDSRSERHFFSTGLYLVAGEEMTITINNPSTDDTWRHFKIHLGIYTDDLSDKNQLLRYPRLLRVVRLVDRKMKIRWMFGGLVSVEGPPELGKKLMMTISGVIPTPHLDISVDQNFDATWFARCQSSGLTADIRGEWVRFTLPVEDSGICTMTGRQVQDLLAKWDKIVLKNWQLRGGQNTLKMESFTCDIQLVDDFLHAGFPIVGNYSHCNKSQEINYMSGNWNEHWEPYHELGHTIDRSIANIFSYFQMERMAGYNWDTLPLLHKHIGSVEMTNWLANPSFDNPNNDTFIQLIVYAQTIRDFGWSCQKEMFNDYMYDYVNIQEWVLRWSRTAGYNLCPLFGTFWKWPLDAATCDALDDLVPYLPDDIITQRPDAAALTQLVETTWAPRLVRTIDNPPNCEPFDIEAIVDNPPFCEPFEI